MMIGPWEIIKQNPEYWKKRTESLSIEKKWKALNGLNQSFYHLGHVSNCKAHDEDASNEKIIWYWDLEKCTVSLTINPITCELHVR